MQHTVTIDITVEAENGTTHYDISAVVESKKEAVEFAKSIAMSMTRVVEDQDVESFEIKKDSSYVKRKGSDDA